MKLRFDQLLGFDRSELGPQLRYSLVVVLLVVLSACSFPTAATNTPLPTSTQEIVPEATATFPVEPTPTPKPLPPDLIESDPFPNSEVGLDSSFIFYFN